jgi:hypothetical protein
MDLRYPIGKFEPQPFSERQKKQWLQDIQFLPGLLEQAIENLDEKQLDTPYREGGWTSRQLIHHVADSHMHAYIRTKLALTEDNPTIAPYKEELWALQEDVQRVPINISITLLYTLHTRWNSCLLSLKNDEFNRTYFHPQQQKSVQLWNVLGLYAWHGLHHVAHITELRKRNNW